MGLTPLAPSGWCLFGIWLLPFLSLSLILGPSSASHSCAEDGSFLWISGSQLTHEDGTQNFANTRTHTFRALSNHPWLQRNSLLFKHHCPAWICSSLLLETSLQSWMGSGSCWKDATINMSLLRASPTPHQLPALGCHCSCSSQGSSVPCSQHHLPLPASIRSHPVLPACPALINPPG